MLLSNFAYHKVKIIRISLFLTGNIQNKGKHTYRNKRQIMQDLAIKCNAKNITVTQLKKFNCIVQICFTKDKITL